MHCRAHKLRTQPNRIDSLANDHSAAGFPRCEGVGHPDGERSNWTESSIRMKAASSSAHLLMRLQPKGSLSLTVGLLCCHATQNSAQFVR